jgi:hypothetical protein
MMLGGIFLKIQPDGKNCLYGKNFEQESTGRKNKKKYRICSI